MSRPDSKIGFHFGTFEVDPASGELRNRGLRISLQEQPFRILVALLERAGQVVTREELRQRVWPEGTFVDFDQGLNTAINRLRDALGDAAARPRFIETLPRRGYRFIGVVEDLRSKPQTGSPAPDGSTPVLGRFGLRAAAVIAAILLLFIGFRHLGSFFPPVDMQPRITQLTSYAGNEREPSFSPDGSQLAFSWDRDHLSRSHIYVKQVGTERLLQLTDGDVKDRNPVWSPDGRWIAFIRISAGRAIDVVLIPALGGPERKLAELMPLWIAQVELAPVISYLAWSPDSKWLAVTDRASPGAPVGLSLLSIETGEKKWLTSPTREWFGDFSPTFSPDGRKLAFIRGPSLSVSELYLLSLTKDFQPEGAAERLTFQNCWIANPVWTWDGQGLLYSCGQWGTVRRTFRIQLTGDRTPLLIPSLGDEVYFIVASHSSRRIAYTREAVDWDIWRMAITSDIGKEATRFLSSTRTDSHAQYSPDGRKIAFESSRSGNSEIWVGNSDGSNLFQLTFIGAPVSGLPRWSQDGKKIVFHSRPKGQADIFVIDAAGGPTRQLTNDGEEDVAPSWSRDGHWIYFDSQRSGQTEVWKIASDGGSPIQVTSNGGSMPLESLDGKFIYYSKTYTKPRTEASLWRMPIAGGKETLVITSLANATTYALTEDRIYFIGPDPSGTGMSIQFRESNSGAVTQIRRLERPIALGLSVSPDRRWILYNQMDQRTSDLMLVENLN